MVTRHTLKYLVVEVYRVCRHILALCLDLAILKIFDPDRDVRHRDSRFS